MFTISIHLQQKRFCSVYEAGRCRRRVTIGAPTLPLRQAWKWRLQRAGLHSRDRLSVLHGPLTSEQG